MLRITAPAHGSLPMGGSFFFTLRQMGVREGHAAYDAGLQADTQEQPEQQAQHGAHQGEDEPEERRAALCSGSRSRNRSLSSLCGRVGADSAAGAAAGTSAF